ncbi:MAG: hypothetical protein J7K68_06200 [Candidatus Diapherotrites archaeon]|nr:hypothetical protein [Candidatus Diapherotrites archaeon]
MARRGITTQRFRIIGELLQHIPDIRNGSIHMVFSDIAGRFGVSEDTVKNVFMDMLWAANPKHKFFREKKPRSRNAKDALPVYFERGVDKKEFEEACNTYLDNQMKKTFTEERLKRINALVDFISKRPDNIRYDALHQFVERYNKGKPKREWVTYETLKNDLYGLAYATIDLPDGSKTTKRDVAPAHRSDFEKVRNAIERGLVDFEKARYASQLFLEHAPENDVERMLRVYKTDDPDIERMAQRFVKYLSWMRELREQHWNAHPARAYSMVWILAGNKIHNEIPEIIDRVYGLHRLAKDIAKGKISVEDAIQHEALSKYARGITKPEQLLKRIEKEYGIRHNMREKELKEIVDKAYKQLWEENFLKVQALFHYEQARIKLGNLIKDHKETMPDGVREYYESLYKTIRRWNDPAKSLRNVPSIPKEHWKRLYKDTVKNYGRRIEQITFHDDDMLNDFHKRILIIGRHLNTADRIYAEHMRVREKNKFRW